VRGEGVPLWEGVAAGNGAVGFGHAVDVDGVEVEVGHLLKEVGRGWGGGDGDLDWGWERGGFLGGAEKCVHGRGGVEVCYPFLAEKLPNEWVVDLAEADVGSANGAYGPGEGPADGVEHGEGPEVPAAAVGDVEARLDNVGESSEVAAAVGVDDTLRLGSRARSERDGNHVVFVVDRHGLQRRPPLGTCIAVVVKSLEDGIVKGTTESALVGVVVDIDNDRHLGMALAVGAEQPLVLGIGDDDVHFSEVEDVKNILGLQTDVDGNDNTAGCHDAVDALEKSGRVGREETNPFQTLFSQIVGEAAGAVGQLHVGAPEHFAIGRDMVHGLGIGFNGSGALEEKCR